MPNSEPAETDPADVDAVTDAFLTASRLLVAISATSIASADESITMPQFRLLVILDAAGPMKLAELAARLGVNPSTATRTVDRLIAASLVSREANPASRREVVLRLTEAGSRVVHDVTSRRRQQLAEIIGRMPDASRHELLAALWAFTAAGGEPPASNSRYDAADTY